MADLPKFDAPPVVEAVIGLQFAHLPQLTTAHVGWYWREYLRAENWPSVNEAHIIEDVFERFGEHRAWSPTGGLKISQANPRLRLQFVSHDDEHMVQVQPSRFLYNWRKRTGDYPEFQKLLPLFEENFSRFQEFLRASRVAERLDLNQWEVTYVNHVQRGDLWDSAADWGKTFPFLRSPTDVENQNLESLRSDWHFTIAESAGRLHIEVKHGRKEGPDGTEIVSVQLTARGPVGEGGEYRDQLQLGHDHLVRSFASMISKAAHRIWKRSQ